MAGELKYTLVVRHPETGEATALLGGESVPDWASELVHEDDLVTAEKSGDDKASAKKTASRRSDG